MKKYIVEITTNENYCTDNWDNNWNPGKYVEAEDAEEAVKRKRRRCRKNTFQSC